MEKQAYSDVAVMVREADLFREEILWIDGFNGSGKSSLSKAIAAEIPRECTILHMDDFLVEKQGAYFDAIRMDDLSGAIASSPRPLIIEGVCLSKIREHLGVQHGISVYVRRVGSNGLWYEEDECQIASEDMIRVDGNPLAIELRQYHYDYQPFEKADYIFDRVEA
ncbi:MULTISPECIES: hypothetical protein [Aeromonas]|uniref:hypothetical protein n=1 Tax=Aeromonas TaxID=642 RepID=UPI000F528B15|nr:MULTISPECIES: hypothetical protein [Aeromonas]MDD9209801.1 hypothetical protein [Aeromonas dhakensis]RQM71285.1 hypothetical protein EHZ82_06705 [Aeromonas hydrophila]